MNTHDIDDQFKSFFESKTFLSLNELQKLSVASVLHEMHKAMQRKIEREKPRYEAHSCDIPERVVCASCSGL